jgi:hypothetical protein
MINSFESGPSIAGSEQLYHSSEQQHEFMYVKLP